ncbi:exo-alpha-sialidase [Jannaschia sp. W003]|uniref:WD40/YVTN/BNR-like repeat-containing protein n=1 Tax=Jannaschia sp. W003 TaxID=2867012 RepID=UPI0028833F3F|nr:exo-alpha-sialidase [Jannaschia sp. W003]
MAALGATLAIPTLARPVAADTIDPVTALAFDGSSALAASPRGLLRREGAAWITLGGVEPPSALAAHPGRPGTLFAGHEDGTLHRSLDGGSSWTRVGAGLPHAAIRSLAVGARTPDTVYAALDGDGVWRSEDAGATWAFVMDRPYLDGAERDVLSLVSVASETGMGGIWLYAGTDAGLTRVPDCFCRWQDVAAGDAMDALVAGNAPPPPAALPEGEPVRILALAPDDPGRLYAALPSGLWWSADAGVNWEHVSPEPADTLAVDPTDPQHVLTAGPAGLRASQDGGHTWTPFDLKKDT